MSDLREGRLIGGVPLTYAEAGRIEKNWAPFEWGGELSASYSVWDGRHVVLRWRGGRFAMKVGVESMDLSPVGLWDRLAHAYGGKVYRYLRSRGSRDVEILRAVFLG